MRALRHGEFGFRGSFERGGYLSHANLKSAFQCSEGLWQSALRRDRGALQGHSTDCGHDLAYMAAAMGENAVADVQRSHGKYIYHGTDVHVVESIVVAEGLLPGGGPGGRLANHFVVGPMPTQWSEARGFRRGSNAVVQCDLEVLRGSQAPGSSEERTVSCWRTFSPPRLSSGSSRLTTSAGTTLRCWRRSGRTADCTSCGTSGPKPWRPQQPWTSAAAAGSADAPASAAHAEGAEAEDADTEPSSSDSELPDTTAPAVAKAEERSGAAAAAPQERSAADVDMAADMTEAAAADPSLTVGELVDKTTKKLEHMSAYMEGAARMVGFEALSSRAGAEHRRVLEHAEELLQKSEVYLQNRAAEAGAAASGAPSSGSAAPASDVRLLEGIDAFMGKDPAEKAEDQDDPMEGPPKKEESSLEELVPDDPGRAHKSATKVPRQFRAATHTAPPPATMAAYTDQAPVIPAARADGMHACPDCGKGLDSGIRWLLHRAANHGAPLPKAIFPAPTSSDQFRQDFRGQWFRINNREGVFFELTETHYARSVRKLGSDVVIPLLVKGDRIRLKDGTRLLYGEGFDEESEEVEVPSPEGGPPVLRRRRPWSHRRGDAR